MLVQQPLFVCSDIIVQIVFCSTGTHTSAFTIPPKIPYCKILYIEQFYSDELLGDHVMSNFQAKVNTTALQRAA